MDCDGLRDDQWERLKEFVPGVPQRRARPTHGQSPVFERTVVDGGFGRALAGLPEHLGGYETVKRRYYRWIERGVLDEILAALAREADLEWLMIDPTIVQPHQHAAGARRKKRGRDAQGLAAPAAA